MRRVCAVMAFAVCVCVVASASYAADKFAYVDLGKLFDEYQKTKDFDKSLEGRVSAYEKDRDAKMNEIKDMQKKLELVAEKEKEKKQKELQDKISGFRESAQSRESELRKERDDKAKEIAKDIDSAVSEFAQKDGCTMVFDSRTLVYKIDAQDVTAKVMEILQAGYKNKK